MKEFIKAGAILLIGYIVMVGALQLVLIIDRTDVTNYEDGSTKITIESENN